MTARPLDYVRVGTRGSALSLWQARWIAERLGALLPASRLDLVTVTTRGDEWDGPLDRLSEPGVFTSALEAALLEGRVDIAVHSLKDLPVTTEGALTVAAVPRRDDPRDALVSRESVKLAELPRGARVGTSSPRRACLIRSKRPDVEVVGLRGNVDTRVRRLEEGAYEAVVLAVAGLTRLGLADKITEAFEPIEFPPAPGQGALAVQVRPDADAALHEAVLAMDDHEARRLTSAERSCLASLGGGCSRPVGAFARPDGESLSVYAFVGTPDGRTVLRARADGADPEAAGQAAADALLRQGAGRLLS